MRIRRNSELVYDNLTMMKIGFLLINHNQKERILGFIDSLKLKNVETEVFVLETATPTDQSIKTELFEMKNPVHIIKTSEMINLRVGFNLLIRKATKAKLDFLYFSTNQYQLDNEKFLEAIEIMNRNQVDVLGTAFETKQDTYGNFGVWWWIKRSAKTVTNRELKRVFLCDWVGVESMLVSARVFENGRGLFEERLFDGGEGIHWGVFNQNTGLRTYFWTDTVVKRYQERVFSSRIKEYFWYRNAWITYAYKSRIYAFLLLVLIGVPNLLRIWVRSKRLDCALSGWKGMIDGFGLGQRFKSPSSTS